MSHNGVVLYSIRTRVPDIVEVVGLVLERRRKRARHLAELSVVELAVVDDLAVAVVRAGNTVV